MTSEGRAKRRYVVAQVGARMHYAVPTILQNNQMLERFYTDVTASKGLATLLSNIPAVGIATLKRLQGRMIDSVPSEKVQHFPFLAVKNWYQIRQAQGMLETYRAFFRTNVEFNRAVLKSGLPDSDAVFGFNGAIAEVFAQTPGRFRVVEQTLAPLTSVKQLILDTVADYPDWVGSFGEGSEFAATADMVMEREKEEWAMADAIVCGSAFVRDGVVASGVPTERCHVVPYGVNVHAGHAIPAESADAKDRPLRVLFVGEVGLRKGAHIFHQVAKALSGRVEFRMLGKIDLGEKASQALSQYADLRGIVPRAEVGKHYRWADVFLLPSLLEGSATVTYEAIGHGVPLIVTQNTGAIIEDGKGGYIVSAGDAESIIERLVMLDENRALLEGHRQELVKLAGSASRTGYERRLLRVL